MTEKVLSILVIDDNCPGDVVAALKTFMTSALEPGNADIDHPSTFDKGASCLQSQEIYDLILFDINLGEEDLTWAGIELLDAHWQSIQSKGSKVMVYSGKPKAKEAYSHFSSGKGPFLFQPKLDDHTPGEAFERRIIVLLRERVRTLCQRASLKSALEVSQGHATTVQIGPDIWSLKSLLSPWLFKVDGEVPFTLESAIRLLFPSDDMIRIFSYWFKGRGFAWPQDQMYGLSTLATYHFDNPTGPMDALMHNPISPKFAKTFSIAAATALADVEVLNPRIDPRFYSHLKRYITNAGTWDEISHQQEQEIEELKNTIAFRLDDLRIAFQQRGARFVTTTAASDMNRELYCPPKVGSRDMGPTVLHAVDRLADSVKKRAGDDWEMQLLVEGNLSSRERPVELPYLVILIKHSGEPCEPPAKISDNWFPTPHAGHGLGDAREALKGVAQWFVLTGKNGVLGNYDSAMDPGSLTNQDAETFWVDHNSSGHWNVLHILKFAFPCFREG